MQISKNELKYLRSLTQKKVRSAEKRFILEGWRALKDLLSSSFEIDLVAVSAQYAGDADYKKILDLVRERKVPLREIGEKELRQVSGTVHAQGIVAVVKQRTATLREILNERAGVILAADAVSDPGNLGSILRTSDWFGVDGVLLGRGSVELYNDKVVRSTAGSLFHVPVVEGVELNGIAKDLKDRGFSLVVLSGDGKTSYEQADWSPRTVLVVGNEGHGVSREVRDIADMVVKIPRVGRAESLNVGVACGIVLSHLRLLNHQPSNEVRHR